MKKLRWRLVKIVFFSVVVVFAIMNLILTVSLRTYNNSQADQMTRITTKTAAISSSSGTAFMNLMRNRHTGQDISVCP